MFWSTVSRLIIVPIALLVAAVATGFVLVTLGLERITGELHRQAPGNEAFEAMFEMVNQGLVLSAGLTVIPVLLVVFVGEIARIRSSLYYVAGGGAALAAIPLLSRIGETGGFAMPNAILWQVFATAGFVGGFVYWLIAGRTA